jgi:hypothetical protein
MQPEAQQDNPLEEIFARRAHRPKRVAPRAADLPHRYTITAILMQIV